MPLRELFSHQPNTATQQLSIFANDEPGAGGANHRYFINGYDCTTNPSGDPRVLHDTPIVFQNGALKEAGPNGVTNEALLAIVEDRLACFQAGKFACAENADALAGIRHAIDQLSKRTARPGRGRDRRDAPGRPAEAAELYGHQLGGQGGE